MMSRGRFLSLEEARKAKQLGRFAKETPYTVGDAAQFDTLLTAMALGEPPKPSGKRTAKRRASRKGSS